jgi:hypothetical protein
LSPWLFIYFIDDLIKDLINVTKDNDSVHFFADDIMVIASSKDETARVIKSVE